MLNNSATIVVLLILQRSKVTAGLTMWSGNHTDNILTLHCHVLLWSSVLVTTVSLSPYTVVTRTELHRSTWSTTNCSIVTQYHHHTLGWPPDVQLEAAKNLLTGIIIQPQLSWEPAVLILKGYEQGTCQQVTGGSASRFCESRDSMWVAQWTKALLAVVEARSITSTWSCTVKFGQGEAEAKLSHGDSTST